MLLVAAVTVANTSGWWGIDGGGVTANIRDCGTTRKSPRWHSWDYNRIGKVDDCGVE
ncbi:hypothetical protein PV328_008913, partial [Microctonus aethiopoides]